MTDNIQDPASGIPAEKLIEHISHDFNNLFSVIIGGLSLLRDEIPSAAWNEDLQITYEDILSAARDATTLVEQLNTWAGRQLLVPAPADVNQILLNLEPLLKYSLGRELNLKLSLHPDPVLAFVDAEALQQSLLHLLFNAREAMPDGGALEISSAPGPCIEIRDRGEGMSVDTLRQCTQPFFTTRRTDGKQGLGLAIVAGFAKASRAQLDIKSELGVGTKVCLLLVAAENT